LLPPFGSGVWGCFRSHTEYVVAAY